MSNEKSTITPENREVTPSLAFVRPLSIDLFLAGLDPNANLPDRFSTDPELMRQAAERRHLSHTFDTIFEQIPDVHMDIADALEERLVTPEDTVNLYTSLTNFLATDEHNARILLYLPSQLLPNLKTLNQQPALAQASVPFAGAYREAWMWLLSESDVRASFVDGDVLEPGMGELPHVRKAAHLVPDLLEKGFLRVTEVKTLMNQADPELARSLADGLAVAADRQFPAPDSTNNQSSNEDVPKDALLGDILHDLNKSLTAIELQYSVTSPYSQSMSHQRVVWEKGVRRDTIIQKAASALATLYAAKKIDISDIQHFAGSSPEVAVTVAALQSIFIAAEQVADADLQQANEIVQESKTLITELAKTDQIEIKNAMIGGVSKLQKLQLMSTDELRELDIEPQDLSSLLPVDFTRLVNHDFESIVDATDQILANPELAPYVYPFFLAFGSRVKGYAKQNADIDVSVFFRPNTPWEKRNELYKGLRTIVPELPERHDTSQFWLDTQNGKFIFRSVPPEQPDNNDMSGQQLIHLVLGSVWLGQMTEARVIGSDLMEQYLDLSRFGEEKDEVRFQLLRRLETNTLQYRLMHKGYRWLYPNKRTEGTPHSHRIDWDSDFWDPGYRRLATQLFVSKVFLPDLTSPHS